MKEDKSLDRANTLCWRCGNATGGCSWSRDFEPVPGWNALERPVMTKNGECRAKSFLVLWCPEFRAESVKDWTARREINEEGLYRMIGQMLIEMKSEYREDRTARKEIREFIQGSIYEKALLEEMTREAEEADTEFEQKLEDMRIAYINNPDLRPGIEKKMKTERFKKRAAHDMEKYIKKMKWEARKHDAGEDAGETGADL